MKTFTEMMYENGCPFDNPWQGKDKKVLFVCSAGILRSATGQRVYGDKYNTRCCGSEEYALIPISSNLILWADEIVFVNKANEVSARKKFDLGVKKVVTLDIPDTHEHMHPELIKAFKEQYE